MSNILKNKLKPLLIPIEINEVPYKYLGECLSLVPEDHQACIIITQGMFRKAQLEAMEHDSTAEKMFEMAGAAVFLVSDYPAEVALQACMRTIMVSSKRHPYIMLCREG